jgi:hypothetical protein
LKKVSEEILRLSQKAVPDPEKIGPGSRGYESDSLPGKRS